MTKKATVEVAVSQRWVYKRRLRFLIAGLVVVCSLAVMALGISLLGQAIDGGRVVIALGLLGCLGGLLYGLNASSVVAAKRIAGDYIWLRGVNRDFLAGLPRGLVSGLLTTKQAERMCFDEKHESRRGIFFYSITGRLQVYRGG